MYIPINVNNAHWIFIEVGFRTKEVQLFDSLSKHQSNNHYLKETTRYIYDALFKNSSEDRPPFRDW